MRHRMCVACGNYRDKSVVDMVKKVEKKQTKAKAEAAK